MLLSSQDHDRWMQLALQEAEQAALEGEVPVGAVIYRGDGVLASAHNQREQDADPTAHAEIVALRAAARRLGTWRLDGCTLAVTLEPCPMCAGALVNSRVPRLVYGAADPKAGAVHTLFHLLDDRRLNHRAEIVSGVMAEPCVRILSQFFQEQRRLGKK